MIDIDNFRELINHRADQLVANAEEFRTSMLEELEKAKDDQILALLKKVDERLTKIEARLPVEEAD